MEMKGVYISVEKSKREDQMENLGVDGRIIRTNMILKKQAVMMTIGFNWHRMCCYVHSSETSVSVKGGECSD
jgi:hypothetical protein